MPSTPSSRATGRQPNNPLAGMGVNKVAPNLEIQNRDLHGDDDEPQIQYVDREVRVEIPVPAPALTDENGVTWIGGFGLSRRGLYITQDISKGDWANFFEVIQKYNDSFALIVGDWLAFGERQYGATYEQVADRLRMKAQTLRDYVWVCSAVDLSLRKDNLLYNHYKAVAHLPYEKQEELLQKASEGTEGKPWSVRRLKAEAEGVPTNSKRPRAGALDLFQKALTPFQERVSTLATKAAPEHREQMAQWLEHLAEQIRKGH